MSSTTPQPDLHHDCLDKLNRVLDLVIKSAETASAEGNHTVVIQAAREVTRIVTLITKITDPKGRSKPPAGLMPLSPGKRESAAPSVFKNQKRLSPPAKADPGLQAAKSHRRPGQPPRAGTLPDLKGLFRDPGSFDDLDPLSLGILQDILK